MKNKNQQKINYVKTSPIQLISPYKLLQSTSKLEWLEKARSCVPNMSFSARQYSEDEIDPEPLLPALWK